MRRDARIFLTQASGGGVASVREQALARIALAIVQCFECRERHEHLAPHFEKAGNVVACQLLRNVLDRAQVRGDVLAGDTVAAGCTDGELALFVSERDREPVELGLRDETHLLGHELFDARSPREQLAARERVVERKHRHAVGDRANVDTGRPPGRWVGESGVTSDGNLPSSSRSSRTSASNSASASSGSSNTK